MEKKLKHLEFIQGVINRLASASFRMKRWSVVLVSALVVLTIEVAPEAMGFVALAPVLIFWGLDGYYLYQERLFRKLYDRVRKQNEGDIDFSMDVGGFRLPDRLGGLRGWLRVVLSKTLLPLYAMLAAMPVLVGWIVGQIRGGP